MASTLAQVFDQLYFLSCLDFRGTILATAFLRLVRRTSSPRRTNRITAEKLFAASSTVSIFIKLKLAGRRALDKPRNRVVLCKADCSAVVNQPEKENLGSSIPGFSGCQIG